MAIFANFWSFFAIFTLFGAFSLYTVEAVLAIFPIFLGFVGIFWGGPPIISPIFRQFGPFLTIFGPFLDHFWANFFFAFFDQKKNPKPQKIRCVAVWRFWGKFLTPPSGGVPHMTKNHYTAA